MKTSRIVYACNGAVDIGGTKIAFRIVDEGGRLLSLVEAASRETEAYLEVPPMGASFFCPRPVEPMPIPVKAAPVSRMLCRSILLMS